MSLSDPLKVTRRFVHALEELSVPYLVGGSLASSLHGIPRATQDVDVVVGAIKPEELEALIGVLKEDFFVDEEMARKAAKSGQTFNIIDKEGLFKVDVFFCGADDASREEMRRRVRYSFPQQEEGDLYLCSPEDIIVHKLYWYKLGGGVSERQWNDACNVLKVQADSLDFGYLHKAARLRGVDDLLDRAMKSVGAERNVA